MRHSPFSVSKNRGSAARNGDLRLASDLLNHPAMPRSLFAALLLVSCTMAGPITGNGQAVYTGTTKTLVFENQGGGFGGPPPGGPCNPQQSTFTLTIETHDLAWALCDVIDTQPPMYEPRNGDRTL